MLVVSDCRTPLELLLAEMLCCRALSGQWPNGATNQNVNLLSIYFFWGWGSGGGGWFLITKTAREPPAGQADVAEEEIRLLPLACVNTGLACQAQFQTQRKVGDAMQHREPQTGRLILMTEPFGLRSKRSHSVGCGRLYCPFTWRNCWSLRIDQRRKEKKEKKRITDSFASPFLIVHCFKTQDGFFC